MKYEEEKERVASFLRIGIIVLTTIAVFALGINYMPEAVTVSTGGNRKLPIYCVDTNKKQVALSFDAAWGNEQTQGILDCVAKYNVKVTFFATGGWVAKYPEDVSKIIAAGHDFGNHSENHKQMSTLSKEECLKEIKTTNDRVQQLTGYQMTLFRPPYGDYNNTLIEATEELGYQCIQWDVDSLDWKDYDAATIVNRILKGEHLGNGSIILMHNGGKHTLEALPMIIEGLQQKGYELVPISQLIYKENYEMDQEGRQYYKK